MEESDGLRVIEFFSGIGGMRLGIERALSGRNLITACRAYEISDICNKVYRWNIVSTSKEDLNSSFSVQTKLVEQLKPHQLDSQADLWTMSPPCQPFTSTRLAKQLDSDDLRCKGLKGIISILNSIQGKPRWILLENVKGFVGSNMLQEWYNCLQKNGYTWKEYLLSPIQFGIPNSRTRYYMICEMSNRFQSTTKTTTLASIVSQTEEFLSSVNHHRKPISDYLHQQPKHDLLFESSILPDDIFDKDWFKELGIVTPNDTITHCFTAAYGRQLHKATGSILCMLDDTNEEEKVQENEELHQGVDAVEFKSVSIDRANMHKYKGKLRRFLPCELLRMFGFPECYSFPDDITMEHQYKLIGNSVNIDVVAYVAGILLDEAYK